MEKNISSLKVEAEKVVKVQQNCEQKALKAVENVLKVLEDAEKALLEADDAAATETLQNVATKLKQVDVSSANDFTKQLHSAIFKLSKAMDKSLPDKTELCKIARPVTFDKEALDKVLADHLRRERLDDVADTFDAESGSEFHELSIAIRSLSEVQEELKRRNFDVALAWAREHRASLTGDGSPSMLEFKLQAAAYLQLLEKDAAAAQALACAAFPAFHRKFPLSVQKLLSCSLYVGSPPEANPYSSYVADFTPEAVAECFTAEACQCMGVSLNSLLSIVSAAGAAALPQILKMATVLEKNLAASLSAAAAATTTATTTTTTTANSSSTAAAASGAGGALPGSSYGSAPSGIGSGGTAGGQPNTDGQPGSFSLLPQLLPGYVASQYQQCTQLPLELDLGREFQFHSVFVCPVAKEPSGVDNPPVLLPCGHVLCERSVAFITRHCNTFKCPYCPEVVRHSLLLKLHFVGDSGSPTAASAEGGRGGSVGAATKPGEE